MDDPDILLPPGYTYVIIPSEEDDMNGLLTLRIREVNSVESVESWFEAFSKNTYWMWRVSETFPHAGRVNLYKKKYRCQHNVPYPHVKNPKRIVESKNTECPARITICVKRYFRRSRSKDPKYQLNADWPCVVEFYPKHNHDVTPPSPIMEMKNFPKGTSITYEENDEKLSTLEDYETINEEPTQETFHKQEPGVLAPYALVTLDAMLQRIRQGVANNPDVFIPALNKMYLNYEAFAKTDDGLISAMYSFGQ